MEVGGGGGVVGGVVGLGVAADFVDGGGGEVLRVEFRAPRFEMGRL